MGTIPSLEWEMVTSQPSSHLWNIAISNIRRLSNVKKKTVVDWIRTWNSLNGIGRDHRLDFFYVNLDLISIH
jgi:hypothetical protein